MEEMVSRFFSRLYLPRDTKIELLNYRKIAPSVEDVNSSKEIWLELYHVIREDILKERDRIIESILKNGFYFGSIYNNKGRGVYFANHGRYSLNWCPGSPVLICHVKDGPWLKRYKSEINSEGESNSEYVVHASEFENKNSPHSAGPSPISEVIKVIGILEYKVSLYRHRCHGYVKHGNFGCEKCDSKKRRCDCESFPIVDPNDII